MEKKKLLLVAISVGIFLVIAIGAAILVFTPRSPAGAEPRRAGDILVEVVPSTPATGIEPVSDQGNSTSAQSAPLDAFNMVRNAQEVPGLKSPPEGAVRQNNDYYVTGTSPSASGRNSDTVISVPKPSTAAVPDTPPAGRAVSEPAPKVTQAAPKPAATAPAAAPRPVAQTTQATKAAPAAPAAARNTPAAQKKVYDDYWVQTGAFSTVATAEVVKDSLATKGIKSIIENRDVDGKTLFRVRVGPYTSQNEADYWLSLIKSIGGFEDSQIRLTQSQR